MPARNKVGTQLLVSPHIKARAQALALVRRESVSEVWRAAIEGGGLKSVEKQHADALDALTAAFSSRGVSLAEGVEAMSVLKLKLNDDGSLPDAYLATI